MVQIKAGQSGIVNVEWIVYGSQGGDQANKYQIAPDASTTPNGDANPDGFVVAWSPVAALFSDTTYRDRTTSGHPTDTFDVSVSVPSSAGSGSYAFGVSSEEGAPEWQDGYEGFFSVITASLTGNVSVNNISGLQACVDLSAEAPSPQKVVSAVIDWGDGNSTPVSPAPDASNYFGNACHTYSSGGTYTVTATYTDDSSDTTSPTTSVTVGCMLTADMTLDLVGSSSSPGGIYVHYYSAGVTPSGGGYSYSWTFPDNTTVTSGGGSGDATAQFSISTASSSGETNFGVVSCTITDTSSSCSATVSRQVAANDSRSTPGPNPSDCGTKETPASPNASVTGGLSTGNNANIGPNATRCCPPGQKPHICGPQPCHDCGAGS